MPQYEHFTEELVEQAEEIVVIASPSHDGATGSNKRRMARLRWADAGFTYALHLIIQAARKHNELKCEQDEKVTRDSRYKLYLTLKEEFDRPLM